jgi:ATP-dependent RNA helicase DeaD
MTRFFVSVGEMDGVDKSGMVRLICDTTGLPNAKVGKIELRRSFSFFEVPEQLAGAVESRFNEVFVNGRQIRLEKTDKGSHGGERERGDRGGYAGKKSGGWGGNSGGGYGSGAGRKDRFSSGSRPAYGSSSSNKPAYDRQGPPRKKKY